VVCIRRCCVWLELSDDETCSFGIVDIEHSRNAVAAAMGSTCARGAIALASHLSLLRFLPAPWQPNQSPDYHVFYEPVARQLAAGRGFYLPSGKPALTYPPGIPMVYGATFWLADRCGLSHEVSVAALQALLTIFSTMLVAALAVRCYGARIALLVAYSGQPIPFICGSANSLREKV
jgi:4-amino-4-deoxy-L-arabinose transferase-like glycosyltransferase